jgi:biopolymer transport protein ExbB
VPVFAKEWFAMRESPIAGRAIVILLLASAALLLGAVLPAPSGGIHAAAAAPADSAAMSREDSTTPVTEMPAVSAGVQRERGGFGYRLRHSGLGDLYVRGGIFMHPLLLSSIVGLTFIIERLWTLSRARTNVRALLARTIKALREKGVDAALEECENTRGPVAAVLHSGLLRSGHGPDAVAKAIDTAATIEMHFLERGLIWLSTVGNIAPLLGFLGTVSGMINAFAAIAQAEQVSAKIVASGIEEALITTLAGLCIAIPVNTMHNYFVSQISKFIVEMEESSGELINVLLEMERSP